MMKITTMFIPAIHIIIKVTIIHDNNVNIYNRRKGHCDMLHV